jgi:hypothetical protein
LQPWLLLIHQVPPSPPYLRAKILRRLKQIGALALKNSAYLLPANDETSEDFHWLLAEIGKEGGDAWIFRADAVGGLTNEEIRERFRQLRSADYGELVRQLQQGDDPRTLKRRLEELRKIDFFAAPGRAEVEELMKQLEGVNDAVGADSPLTELKGRTWVTRRGIKIDRTACAWLIRRFIDSQARFAFVDPGEYKHGENEIRFDMFDGEFTHEGDLCTFEVLLERGAIDDPALRVIGQIVHDLDLKDARYDRPETTGIGTLIEGLARHGNDTQRLEEGVIIFDALYARLKSQ